MIIKITDSPIHHKRYRATVATPHGNKTFDFGLRGGHTYIDGVSEETRDNYWKRHMANTTEERLIKNLVVSPSLLSAFLLWGKSRSLAENAKHLNHLWETNE